MPGPWVFFCHDDRSQDKLPQRSESQTSFASHVLRGGSESVLVFAAHSLEIRAVENSPSVGSEVADGVAASLSWNNVRICRLTVSRPRM
jgi:hypothetical protein